MVDWWRDIARYCAINNITPIIDEDCTMSGHINEKKAPAKVRPGAERRVTSNEYKAKMADGFAAVAKRMEEERWK